MPINQLGQEKNRQYNLTYIDHVFYNIFMCLFVLISRLNRDKFNIFKANVKIFCTFSDFLYA